jgi:hypothetical protein
MPSEDRRDHGHLDAAIAEIARYSAATVHVYPRPGRVVKRIQLRDTQHDQGTQSESAELDTDGTLRVVGRDAGPKVSDFFGASITRYEWVYVLTREQVSRLRSALGADADDDVLAALRAYYDQQRGQIHDLLTSPQVAANFSNWHS